MDMAKLTREEVIEKVAAGKSLERANLVGIDLSEADLRGADLREADLCEAGLCEAVLREADLRGANLSGTSLNRTDLRGALYDKDTVFSIPIPKGFDPEAAGLVLKE